MVLVEHQRVEPGLLGRELLVEVAVIEQRPEPRVVVLVAQSEVEVGLARGGAEEAVLLVLVGPFREMPDQHRLRLSRAARERVADIPAPAGRGYGTIPARRIAGAERSR